MARQPGFFDIDERLRVLSSKGGDLDRLNRLVDFELFAPISRRLFLARIDARVGGRRSVVCRCSSADSADDAFVIGRALRDKRTMTNWPSYIASRDVHVVEKLVFLIVGGFCGSCYLALAWTLHFLGLSATTSSALAYAVCVPLGYIGQRSITFRSTRPHTIALTGYLAVQGIAVLIVTAVTFVSAVVLRHPPVLAFFLAGAVAASASYLMQKYFVFREHRRGPD